MKESFNGVSKTSQEKTDTLLDELSFHLNEVERIKSELALSLLDKSDSELWDEQRQVAPIVNTANENPLFKQLEDEERTITELKSKIATQNQ